MSELKEAKYPELDRCLNAIYLELPKGIADDVNRIVREAIQRARTEAAAEAYARAAESCVMVMNRHGKRSLVTDSYARGVIDGAQICKDDILALSPDPDYSARIRREVLEESLKLLRGSPTTPLLAKIVEICDAGSAAEFGDADERLRAIRGLIIGEAV